VCSWCGPCKLIGPVFAEMAGEFSDIVFVGVNIDDEEFEEHDLISSVGSIPLFHIYKDGKKIGEMLGAKAEKLRELVEQLNSA
jgi:thioredoxin